MTGMAAATVQEGDPLVAAAHEVALRHQMEGLKRQAAPIDAWSKLKAMETWLENANTVAATANVKNASATEWLLDNDFQVHRAILQIGEDLPQGFYARLPGIGKGEEAYPRVYELAHALLDASRLQIAYGTAIHFLSAYQDKSPLSIAELWAFPTMLRIACLELLVTGFGQLFDEVPPPFQISKATCLNHPADPTECVARAIANLGVISSIQWKDFFDRTSRVEIILRTDPADVYARMDFETRDHYRQAVEKIAEGSGLPEWEIADHAIAKAHQHRTLPSGHVGHWLVGAGRAEFEDGLPSGSFAVEALSRKILRFPAHIYVAALFLVSLAGLALPAFYLAATDASAGHWVLGMILSALPASMLSVTLVNWIATLAVAPRVLPKLDFEKGIAPDCSTAVVMPVIVAHDEDADCVLRRLESHYLANPDPLLHFVLLSDLMDANDARHPDDDRIEQALVNGIATLNTRHGAEGIGPFHLLHRARLNNPAQGYWMGWERKRGKLEQFNNFVLTGDRSPFPVTAGMTDTLRAIRFIVTADADTRLPPGVVNRMVATLAHPLNQAQFDARTGRVTAGYTILQPRVEIAPGIAERSLFTRFFGGDTAIDIYSRAVSDVYQDLFGSGIFVGKGIYEVATFTRSLEGRIPENCLLSHDLFEGLHGRAGLASDIIIFEGFPSGYLDHVHRWHRWVRGDWQIMPWLFPMVPGREQKWLRNQLTLFDRIKIFDNLRRSLVPISIFALMLAGWFILPGNPLVWTLLAIAAPGASLFTDLVTGFATGRRRGVLQSLERRFIDHVGRWALVIIFLINDAAITGHAIVVTLWRLVARSHLLEWTSAAHVSDHFARRDPRRAAWREMWVSPATATVVGAALIIFRPMVLGIAIPLLLVWFLAPEIAIAIAKPIRPPVEELSAADRTFLRKIARRTWLYFETFVRPEDNWLPPDNYQEPPDEEIAHRTSPTNVGVMLLGAVTAWKLGHISLNDFTARLRNTLDSLDRLERYRGHMLNWYDTRTLQPLEPRFASTVDSGNLAVSLVVMSEACREAMSMSASSSSAWDGLLDELALLNDALENVDAGNPCHTLVSHMIDAAQDPGTLSGGHMQCERLTHQDLPALREAVHDMAIAGKLTNTMLREIQLWIERIDHHLRSIARDNELFRPWLALLGRAPPGMEDQAARLANLLMPNAAPMASAAMYQSAHALLDAEASATLKPDAAAWRQEVADALDTGQRAETELRELLASLAERSARLAHEMDFTFLFDTGSRLFHIGYNISADRIDPHHYDLLASEARLASFFAIAKGDVPFEHWFFLGRPITKMAAGLALVSWNGSMFEYLMPNLFLRSDPGTLLGQSDRTAVDLQRAYGEAHDIPWGISESAYASKGNDRAYRYHAFGVPGLGLRRGLERDLVVSPYASALALAVRTGAAIRNLRALAGLGLVGRYGFYEAVDFTPGRSPHGQNAAIVRSYMVHHHGMSLGAIGNALCDNMLVRWFHEDPHVRTVDLLLNERIPWELPPELTRSAAREATLASPATVPALHPWQGDIRGSCLHAVGNGRMTTHFGSGGSGTDWQGFQMTGSTPGPWLHIRDLASDLIWDATPALTLMPADSSRVQLHAERIECHRRDHDLSITTEIGIAHGDDVEIRRVTVVNEGDHPLTIELTRYAEVVLAPPHDAARHPAFSKLFVGSEAPAGLNGLLFTRRPRSPGEHPPVLFCRVIGDDEGLDGYSFETDRAAFIGRLNSPRAPIGIHADSLSGSLGWTLDPIVAQRVQIELPPGGRRELAFLTVAAASHATALEIAERYTTLASLKWAMDDAAAHAAREMHQLGLTPDTVPAAHRLLARLAGPDSDRLPAASGPPPGAGRAALWSFGVSGDAPILLLRAGDGHETQGLRFLIAVQMLCRLRGVPIDLIVIHEGEEGYIDPVRERLLELLRETGVQDRLGQRNGIHLAASWHIKDEVQHILGRAARLDLDERAGSIMDQIERQRTTPTPRPRFTPIALQGTEAPAPPLGRITGLLHDNGLGGFTTDTGAYVIHLEPGETTPAPWSNILANENFGTIVTEAGLGFSWAINAGENRLTPWNNDPVCDPQSECLYLRDEENAHLWTVSPHPIGGENACRITHGAGYTRWERASEGLEQEMLAFVSPDDPVKIVRLRLRNLHPRARRITATYFAQWLLGSVQGETAPLRSAEYDPDTNALLAVNPWSEPFGERVAFLCASRPPHSLTVSRSDFLGATDDVRQPEALTNWDLGGRFQAVGDDCCAAYQVHIDIAANAVSEITFILGQGDTKAHALDLIARWQDARQTEQALERCAAEWRTRLGAVTVATPDSAFDILVNRWLPYQAVSSRLRARAGFYQAGGAFGFRDQLQDVLALRHIEPALTRRHILEAAAHQFEQGDVLHWWHPPTGAGVRTRCSDDLLWLTYATAAYVEATGDRSILAERIPFLSAPMLGEDEADRYASFGRTAEARSLFEHCERALEHAHRLGRHGLPLIGDGDWNDGMNRIGDEGHGESVWLGWFHIATINSFIPLCMGKDRPDLVARWERRAADLARAIETSAWDGDWYLRAFDDDGRPWGTAADYECRIDSITQSWARISGAGHPERIERALHAAQEHLVRADDRLVRLLSPPFSATPRDPGYIKAYPPGVRENGGQYTHAAAWLGIAFALSGDGNAAMEIFRRINPICQTGTRDDSMKYRTEPYVLAADVAGSEPHVGRGGWSWYTGAAAWTWRLAVEHILGLTLIDGKLRIAPCLPTTWKTSEATLRRADGALHVRIDNPDGLSSGGLDVTIDGSSWKGGDIAFPLDGSTRHVVVRLCARQKD